MCCVCICIYWFVQGFCVPAELSDDDSKDGGTKFEDIEGGGIGDGEGVKDVSEQIESEEQVGLYVVYIVLCFYCYFIVVVGLLK